jgi:hypothetical protein
MDAAPALLVSTDLPFVAMGLFAIARVLEAHGSPCRVLRYESYPALVEEIIRTRAGVIGFSAHWHSQLVPSVRIAQRLKRDCPGLRIVLGGYTASWFAEDLAKLDPIDGVVVGAGEKPFLALVQGAPRGTIGNLVWRAEDGAVVRNPVRCDLEPETLREFVYGSLEDFERAHRVIRIGTGCFFHCFHCGGSRKALAGHGCSSPVFLEADDIAGVIARNFDALGFDRLYLAQDPFRDLKAVAAGMDRLPDRIKGRIALAVAAWGRPRFEEVRRLCASAPKVCLELTFDSLDPAWLKDSRGFACTGPVLEELQAYTAELFTLPNLEIDMYFSYPHLHAGRFLFPDLATLGALFDLELAFRKERLEGRFGLRYLLLSTDPESSYGSRYTFQEYWDRLLAAPSGLGSFCCHYEGWMEPDEFMHRHLFIQGLMHLFEKATTFTQDMYRRTFKGDIRTCHDTLFTLFREAWVAAADRGARVLPGADEAFGYSCRRQEMVDEERLASAARTLVDRCLQEGIFDRDAWEREGVVL